MRSGLIAVLVVGVLVLSPAGRAAPKEEVKVPWEVTPDPLPWKMEARFPEGKSFPLANNGSVHFPTSASSFACVVTPGGKGKPAELQMIDIRTLEPVGKTLKSDTIDLRHLRVSPFGEAVATIDAKAEKPTIMVWSMDGQAVVPSFAIHEEKTKIEGFDFGNKGHILSVKEIRVEKKPRRLWETWDIRTGKQSTSIHYQLEYHIKWTGFSPGRKYLTMQETHIGSYKLLFWDLTTGKLAGKLDMQDGKSSWGQCGNITFMPDGKEAALSWRLCKDGISTKIMRFDIEKGRKIGEHALQQAETKASEPGLLAGGMRTLQALPDGRGWLLCSHQIIERETGKVVWAIRPAPRYAGDTRDRRFADAYHISEQVQDGGKKLQMVALPKAQLDAAFQKARANPR